MNNSSLPDTLSAKYYDLIYSFKDYTSEAESLSKLILNEVPDAKTILDVACGTHEHARTLTKLFSVDGLDHNLEYLAAAQAKNPFGRYTHADMQEFKLQRRYDAVICLSSSIGYLRDITELGRALDCFEHHLNPGGVIFIEPWFTPETWQPGKISVVLGETDSLKVVRGSIRRTTDSGSLMTFHYMVLEKPDRVEIFREDHHLALFSHIDMLSVFSHRNFSARHIPSWSPGRGLFIGRRIADSGGDETGSQGQ